MNLQDDAIEASSFSVQGAPVNPDLILGLVFLTRAQEEALRLEEGLCRRTSRCPE